MKNALAYYNAGVVAVNSKVVRLDRFSPTRFDSSPISTELAACWAISAAKSKLCCRVRSAPEIRTSGSWSRLSLLRKGYGLNLKGNRNRMLVHKFGFLVL
jgi:hypothetical protein